MSNYISPAAIKWLEIDRSTEIDVVVESVMSLSQKIEEARESQPWCSSDPEALRTIKSSLPVTGAYGYKASVKSQIEREYHKPLLQFARYGGWKILLVGILLSLILAKGLVWWSSEIYQGDSELLKYIAIVSWLLLFGSAAIVCWRKIRSMGLSSPGSYHHLNSSGKVWLDILIPAIVMPVFISYEPAFFHTMWSTFLFFFTLIFSVHLILVYAVSQLKKADQKYRENYKRIMALVEDSEADGVGIGSDGLDVEMA